MPPKPAPAVFISYSHRDEGWKDRLVEHLDVLATEGLLSFWDDRQIDAGEEWQREIETALAGARVAVILVTRHFLRSPFIRGVEVPEMLRRREENGLLVFPIIVTSCAWDEVAFLRRLQARPTDGKPLASFKGDARDRQLTTIAKEIRRLAKREADGAKPLRPESALDQDRPRMRPVGGAPAAGLDGRDSVTDPAAGPDASDPTDPAVGRDARDLATATAEPEPGRREAVLPPPALHQLPSPPADFVGRETELAELRAAAAAGRQVAIFGLRGMGGVGKTTLALKLAEELAPRYPDGQLFLDLLGVATAVSGGTPPVSAAQAMAHVLRSFHPEARVPEEGQELAGRYRSVLHDKRVLLLMDNAAGPEQVEPLIPPAGCALLVTSRFHFSLPGATTRDLDELPEAEALALLRGIAGRLAEDEAGEIARLCGCLPFALRLAGSALADRPDLSPAEYAQMLQQAGRRFGPVDARLAVSADLLPEETRGLWYRLAVFPATFDAEAAAAVGGLETDAAGEALGELVTASLVEWEAARYRQHDLARLFAWNRLDREDQSEARRRHADHYLEVLRRNDRLYKQGGPAILEGLRLFDAEWPNLQAGQSWAAENAAADPEAARLCSAYPDTGTYCLALRQSPREQIRWRQAALEVARGREDRAAQEAHLNSLGLAYAALGAPRRAIDFHEQVLAIARDIGDRRGEGATLGNLGLAYADLGEPRRAIDFHEQALAIARDIGDRRSECAALCNLGLAYAALGEPRHAIDFYEQDLAIARDIGDRHGEGTTLGSLGAAYAALGEPRRAIDFYEQRLAIARDIGDRNGEGGALGNLGLAYAALGEPRRAIDFHEQYLAIARDIGDRRGEGTALGNLGAAYVALGAPRRAIDFLEQHLAITRNIGDRSGEGAALGNLGAAYAVLGEPRRAIDFFEQHLAIARDIGDRRGESTALGNLGNAYAALGEPRRAIDFLEQNLAITRDIGDRAGEARTSWNLGLTLEEEGDLERAAELMQIWVDYEREIGHPDAGKHAARVDSIRSRTAGSPARKSRGRRGSSRGGGRAGSRGRSGR